MCDSLGHARRGLILCLQSPGSGSLLVPGEADSKEEILRHGGQPRAQHAQSGLCLLSTALVLPIAGVMWPVASPLPVFFISFFWFLVTFPSDHPFFPGPNLAVLPEGFAAVKQLNQNDPAAPC